MANRINFNIGFQIDKAGLNTLQDQLNTIAAEASLPSNKLNTGLQEAAKTAKVVENALNKAFNVNLGTANISKFNQELKSNNLTIQQVKNNLSKAGAAGANAFNLLGSQILKTNVELKNSNKLLDEMATSMANTIKWGVTSSIFNNIANSIQKAYGYTKNLDSSLNDIRIVTDKSAESMQKFAVQANNAAKELGASTLDYTQASLIYYQQGLSDEESAARAETTLKAANVTGQTGAEVSEQLTAVWNGYKVTAEETELYVDKLAAVAATTAADLEELSTGMSKVASAANLMGVDMDQLNAQLATIVSVTRQAPESVGTALKTIYARMGDIEAGVDTETTLGNYTAEMEAMGFNVLDMNGNLRDMGEVIEEIGEKWSTMSREQQIALSQTMAGTRQYNNLLSLFDNWNMYTKALETSANAMGTLQKQNDIYMESTKAHLTELRTSLESIYSNLIDTNELNTALDLLTNFAQVANNFIGSFGGGLSSITGIGVVIANIFNKQIATGINNTLTNHRKLTENADLLLTKFNTLKEVQKSLQGTQDPQGMSIAAGYDVRIKYAQEILQLHKSMTTEDYSRLTSMQEQVATLEEEIVLETKTVEQLAKKHGFSSQIIENYFKEDRDLQSIIDLRETDLKKTQETTKSLEEQINFLSKITSETKNQTLTAQQRNKIYQSLSKLDNSILTDKEKQVKTVKQLQAVIEKIVSADEHGLKANQNETKELKQQLDILLKIQQAKNKKLVLNQQQSSIKNDLDLELERQKKAAGTLAKVTEVSSALSSVAMTWMSINSLADTLTNENLSAGEKALQIAMTLGLVIPNLISTYTKLNETVGFTLNISKVLDAQRAKKAALIAVENAEIVKNETATRASATADILKNVSTKQAEKALWGKIAAGKIDISTITEANAAEVLRGLGLKSINKLTDEQITALWAKIAAQIAEKKSTDAQTTSQLALNAAQMASPVGLVIAGLVALTAAIAGVVTIQKKQLERTKELAKAQLEESKQRQTEVDENIKLFNSYLNINEQYKKGIASKEDMANAAETVCNALELEGDAVANLTGDYDALTKSIINAQKEALKKEKEQLTSDKRVAEENILANARIDQGWLDKDIYKLDLYSSSYNSSGKGFTGPDKIALGILKETISSDFIKGQEVTGNNMQSIKLKLELDAADNQEDLVQLYDEFYKAREKIRESIDISDLGQSDYYSAIDAWLDKMEESITEYKQVEQRFANISGQEKILDLNFTNIIDYNDFQTKFIQLIDGMRSLDEYNNLSLEQVQNEALNLVSSSSDSIAEYAKQFQQIESMANIYGEQHKTEITKWVTGLSEEELTILYTLDIDETSYDSLQEKIDEAIELAKGKKIELQLIGISDLRESITSGKELDEEKRKEIEKTLGEEIDWKEFDLSTPIEQLEILSQLTNELNQQSLEYYNNITTLEKENAINKENEAKAIQKEIEEKRAYLQTLGDPIGNEEYARVAAEINQLRKELEMLDSTYTTDFGIEFEDTALDIIINKVDNIISKADALKSAAELIGEGFLVAAEDAEALFAVYPELMENSKVLADGNIQLNQETVKAITQGNSFILTEDAETTKKQLENKITLLDAEIAYQEIKIQALKDYLSGEIDAQEMSNRVNKAGSEYEEKLIDALGVVESNAAQVEINNSENTTNIALSNLDKIGERIKAVSQAYANMLAGDTVNYTSEGNTALGGSAQSYTSSKEVESVDENLSEEEVAAIQAQLDGAKTELDSLLQLRGQYTVLLSKITSGASDATKALSGAGSGKGGKINEGKDDRDESLKSIQEEIDRYWELNKTIEKVTDTIEKLNDEQSKLSGKELIASLKEENELLEQQAEAYKALANEQQREANELRGVLSTYGVVFDAQGGVANYLAASQQALNYYNDAVVKYNSHIIDEATFNAAQSSYENFKSQLERYEALYYEEMKDTQDQLDELHTQQLENNLEQWEVGIQLQLDLSEAERNWNDFLQEINEDFKLTYADISQELSTLLANAQTFTNEEGTFETDIKALKDVMAEIDKFKLDEDSNMFSSMSEAQEKLKELIDTTQSDMSSLYDIFANAWNAYMEGIDQSADKFDDLMGQFENIENELDYQGKLIELIYGEEAYSLLDTLYKAQEKNNYVQIDALKQQRDMWHTLWENAAEGTEEQTKYYELWTQAQDDLNNKVTDYIELLKTDYLNTIDDILKKLETNITGSSLDDLEEEWDRVTESSDKYLDNVESLYEVQTLANKISNSISETSSLKNQQKLQELYDKEIDYLREKENLTKYDLDAANARYEIALKEIALEEAQNSKNSMKLTRGTDGNWSYQYVADQDLVAEKQQDLTDAYKELYDLSKDAYEENLESLTDLQDKYLEAYREIIADETLAAEEKEQKIHELQSYYLEQYNLLAKENALYKDNLATSSSALLLNLYNQDKENFAAMTQEERELVQNLVDANANDFMTLESLILNNYDNIGNQATSVMSKVLDAWSTGAQQIADIWNADDGVSVKAQITEAQNNILDALDTYNYKVEEIAGVVEENFGPDGITGSIQDAEAATEDLEYAVSNLVDNTIDQLYDYRDALEDIEDMWYSVKDAIMEAIDAAREYANAEAIRKKQSAQTSGSLSSADTSGFANLTPSGGGGGDNPTTQYTPPKVKDPGPSVDVTLYSDLDMDSLRANYTATKKDKDQLSQRTYYSVNDRRYFYKFVGGSYITPADREKIKNVLGFDTGGYTGDWDGSDGKLAMLHSKELVLNAKDTSNILDAVEVIRDISNLSSSIESMIMDKLSAMILKLGNLNANRSYTSNVSQQDSIENNYYINAEFPNANDVNDIREALLSLSNVASQYRAENKK